MTSIGGFLPLEPRGTGAGPYHQAPAFSTGRACFRYLVERLRPRLVHVPFYVCEALLAPLRRHGIPFRFYPLDGRLRPAADLDPRDDELVLLVSYFGIQGDRLDSRPRAAAGHLVIDDTQAFFRAGESGTWSFNSARKFFGVPDGAYLFGPDLDPPPAFPAAAPSIAHLENRLAGRDALAYEQFRRHESALDDSLRSMSAFSVDRLATVDYSRVAARRRESFSALAAHLAAHNELELHLGPRDVPLYYPFLPRRSIRESLLRRNVFVPTLWPEVSARPGDGFEWERVLAARLCPLPVDQRYDASTMEHVVAAVLQALAEGADGAA